MTMMDDGWLYLRPFLGTYPRYGCRVIIMAVVCRVVYHIADRTQVPTAGIHSPLRDRNGVISTHTGVIRDAKSASLSQYLPYPGFHPLVHYLQLASQYLSTCKEARNLFLQPLLSAKQS